MKEHDLENYGATYRDEYGEIYPPYYHSIGKDYSISEEIKEGFKRRKYRKEKEEENTNINIGDIKYIIAFLLLIWILYNISKLI